MSTVQFRTISIILVRRPADAKRFNGTVVVEWQNVSGGFDIDAAWLKFYQEILREGYAWVGVSAQRAGVHPPPLIPGLSQPLLVWDPLRYGTLSVPNDDTSYDIFSQAGQAVGPDRPSLSNDPMGGLPVVQAIAAGQSQSGSRMATYVNGVHFLAEVFDGFLVMSRSAGSARLAAAVPLPSAVLIRTDLDVPVLALNTETEGVSYFPARQPDTESFRYWEVAGSAHQTAFDNDILAVQFLRDLGVTLVENCDNPVNDLPFHYVANAALSSMDAWARGGPPAASLPRIAVSGSPLAIERDALGNALGGIRLPQLEVPVAQYGGIGTPLATCRLQGFVIPFSAETLAELYRNHGHYASSFAHATRGAEDAGFLLHQDAQEGIGAASHAAVP